mgnify:CR=1 FL=1
MRRASLMIIAREIRTQRICHLCNRHALQPHSSRSRNHGIKNTLAAEEHILHSRHRLHFDLAGACHGCKVSRVHNNLLSGCKFIFFNITIKFQKCGSNVGKLLHNKSLSSEKSAPDSLLKEHGQIHAGYSSKKCRFLHDQILSRYNIKRPD